MQGNNLIINDAQPISSVFFPESLQVMKNRDYNIQYAELNGLRLVPIDRTTAPWAQVVGYNQYDLTGEAKVIATQANDLPMTDATGQRFFNPIVTIGASYKYTKQEIEFARQAGVPFKENKRASMEKAHLEKVNTMIFQGDSEANIVGWLNVPTVNKVPVAGANANARKWFGTGATKTALQIVDDLNEAYNYIYNATGGKVLPNRVAMGLLASQKLKQTYINEYNLISIWDYWVDTLDAPMVLETAKELDGAFPGATNGFIMYRYDINDFWFELPMLFEEYEPSYTILEWIFPSFSRVGGITMPYPKTQAMRYGI